MTERINTPKLDVKRVGTEPAIRIEATAAGTGPDILVDGSITAGTFSGAVPPSPYTQTFATADKTHAARTSGATTATAATSVTPFGYAEAQANEIVTNLNAVRADLADTAALLNSVIDDLQALGLLS